MTDGPTRREALIDRLVDEFMEEYRGRGERKQMLGLSRIAMLEATRGAMYATQLSPAQRIAIEEFWGFSGVTRNGDQAQA